MSNNYVLLERIELNDTAASVTFDNIPQSGYTDLKVVASVRGSDSAIYTAMNVSFNGTSVGFTGKIIEGAGSGTPASGNPTTGIGDPNGNTSTANTFGNVEIYIPNYRSSSFKSFSTDGVGENNATTAYAYFVASLWSNTAAITSIGLLPTGGQSWLANSTFSLYGLAAVGVTPTVAPKADGGNVIGTDGTYWYHAFLSNGTFTPQVGLSCDVLVVAGGGGGGRTVGGGGGAGGLLGFNSQSLTAINYSITVGGGGAGGTSFSGTAVTGNDSQFSALTLVKGGGGGGGGDGVNGLTGGSGGGGGGAAQGQGGSGTSGQGFAGFTWGGSGAQIGGGGGGSSAAATNKNGANGVTTYSAWGIATGAGQNVSGTVYFAGGGGAGTNEGAGGGATVAGTGGFGGGASGRTLASAGVPTAATPNTGGGGGGSGGNGDSSNGSNGGSGIVIIRYLVA